MGYETKNCKFIFLQELAEQIFNNEQLVNLYKQTAKLELQCNIRSQLMMVSRICSDTMLQSH